MILIVSIKYTHKNFGYNSILCLIITQIETIIISYHIIIFKINKYIFFSIETFSKLNVLKFKRNFILYN